MAYKEKPKKATVSPARVEALRTLLRVERDGAFAAPLLASERMDALSTEDRHLTYELVLGVLRHRGELDYLVNVTAKRAAEKLDLPVRVALWLGFYQLRHLTRIPEHAAVNDSVNLMKESTYWRAAPLVNAALRGALREPPEVPGAEVRDPLNRASIALSHPKWLYARWVEVLGSEEAEALARANNEHPNVSFRVNGLRAPSLGRVLEDLEASGVEMRPSEVAPDAFVVTKGTLAPAIRSVKQGWIYVQDEASQRVASLVGARAGDRVLDVGAAPGGKTSQMAAAMGNGGTIVAVDLHPARLVTLAMTCHRLAVRNVRPLAADASRRLPVAAEALFDRILLDAPCSGTGTLRRNPEIKWRLTAADLERFADLQGEMLETAAAHVKPGGRLVYSTCSLEPEENEAVVARLLERRPEFRVEPADAPEALRTSEGYMRTYPHRHGSDGFFAAVLARAE